MEKKIKNVGHYPTARKPSRALSSHDGSFDENKEERAERLILQIQQRLQDDTPRPVPVEYIWIGLIGMLLLLLGAQASMGIVEQGAVLPWLCTSRWWIHIWYMMVLFTALVDSYAQLPFRKQWNLTLSDIPYQMHLEGGELFWPTANEEVEEAFRDITATIRSVSDTLKKPEVRPAATVVLHGAPRPAKSRNTIFVMVSIVENKQKLRKAFFRATSQLCSIGVFITGTAMFASAQLLPIAMATFVLTLVLAAGIFGRTIAGWIVAGIERAEPMIHYVADTDDEAHYIIARLLKIKLDHDPLRNPSHFKEAPRQVQVEINGHIFVDCYRVASRWTITQRVLGIIAPTYDMLNAIKYRVNVPFRTTPELRFGSDGEEDGANQPLTAVVSLTSPMGFLNERTKQ